jgi:hypothetical protein
MKSASKAYLESSENEKRIREEESKNLQEKHKKLFEAIFSLIEDEIEDAIKSGTCVISGRMDEIFPNYKKQKNHMDIITEVFRQLNLKGYDAKYIFKYEFSFFSMTMGYRISWADSYIHIKPDDYKSSEIEDRIERFTKFCSSQPECPCKFNNENCELKWLEEENSKENG